MVLCKCSMCMNDMHRCWAKCSYITWYCIILYAILTQLLTALTRVESEKLLIWIKDPLWILMAWDIPLQTIFTLYLQYLCPYHFLFFYMFIVQYTVDCHCSCTDSRKTKSETKKDLFIAFFGQADNHISLRG